MTDNYFPAEHAIKELRRLAEDAKKAGLSVEEVFEANRRIYYSLFGEEATNRAIHKLLYNTKEYVYAPFDEKVIAGLNRFQTSRKFHPFTCGVDHEMPVRLIACKEGWICAVQTCTYTQDWAHGFMVLMGEDQI